MRLIKNVLAVSIFLLLSNLLSAQQFFQTLAPAGLPPAAEVTKNIRAFRVLQLNEAALRTYLSAAPLEFQNSGEFLPLEVPLPNGKTESFQIVEAPLLSPEVAAQHPEIKSYIGRGTTNSRYSIRFTLTASGFHAILLNIDGNTAYFAAYSATRSDLYFTYFVKDAVVPPGLHNRTCVTIDDFEAPEDTPGVLLEERNNSGPTLRTYRLAMAANGEFTALHGGTEESGFDAVVVYVNNMDALFRIDLAVAFSLVSGENLIYTDPDTDPYDNDDQILMLEQNHNNCDNVIGTGNYDIGHVWGYIGGSGGGIASRGSVCRSSRKGEGVSGEGDVGPSDYSQVFMDQLLFHEVGHQFGMNHSYNSVIPVCETRNAATSVEPGSGATIMSYGFTCSSDDYFNSTQTGPILHFHTTNYAEAEAYISGNGACYAGTGTGNASPSVTMPAAFTIPHSTPFILTGSASDPDDPAENLTYSWEGTNIGTMTPDVNTLSDTEQPPFFRSYEPASSPSRTFPILSAILDGTNYAVGDKLPSVGIVTTHRLTVRDNYGISGGVSYGNVSITVNGSIGPFLVTSNLAGSYPANSTQTVTWSVNGTNAATSNVRILLSTDGGFTFPITLLASTPNDGSQTLTLPDNQTTTARIKVEAVGNIFFDISNTNFTISEALPIDLLRFDVSLKNKNEALLEWKSAAEVNSEGYEIEVSKANEPFTKAGFVKSQGTAAAYKFKVPGLNPDLYYFRLKMMDTDGSFSYSPVKSLQVGSDENNVRVYPNPSKSGTFSIELFDAETEQINLKVMNSLGQLILEQTVEYVSGPVALQLYTPGVYDLVLTLSNGTTINKRIIVL